MRHQLSEEDLHDALGPAGPGAAAAIESCVHCGFCLPTCPTYAELGDEADSPRGRIVLMKSVLEGRLQADQVLPHVDGCLGCLACETSCPSGVEYGHLVGPFREYAERHRPPDRQRSRLRKLMLNALESPRRLQWLGRLARLGAPLRSLLPESLQAPLELLPESWPRRTRLPRLTPAVGERRARVLLFPGCVQQVLESDVHHATIEVLAHCGVEVVVPSDTACCGALAAHIGERDRARELARRNLDSLVSQLADVDAVVTNVAGCGSGIAEYTDWLSTVEEPDDEVVDQAKALIRKTRDVSVFLVGLGAPAPPPLERPVKVAVQDACHLRHAQGVTEAPRNLLRMIRGLEICEPDEADVCCGSAGLYNVEQPAMAQRLGRRKARKLVESGADLVASGNLGCIIQLRRHLADHVTSAQAFNEAEESDPQSDPLLRLETLEQADGSSQRPRLSKTSPRVMHTMQILRDAYQGVLSRR